MKICFWSIFTLVNLPTMSYFIEKISDLKKIENSLFLHFEFVVQCCRYLNSLQNKAVREAKIRSFWASCVHFIELFAFKLGQEFPFD